NVVRPTFQAPRVVLAATDFSEVGARALVQALGMVAEGGVVHVAHVIAPAPSAQEGRRVTEQAWYDLAKECEKVTSLVLERHVVEGAPAPQLLALAALIGADLIVLGARTHSVVGVLLGS